MSQLSYLPNPKDKEVSFLMKQIEKAIETPIEVFSPELEGEYFKASIEVSEHKVTKEVLDNLQTRLYLMNYDYLNENYSEPKSVAFEFLVHKDRIGDLILKQFLVVELSYGENKVHLYYNLIVTRASFA